MLILVEGPDCTRKSSLVARLAEHVTKLYPGESVDILNAGPPTQHPLDEYVTPLLDYRPLRDRHVICDRWHIGEAIYPTIFKRETRMDYAVQAYVELFLRSRGALLVVVDATTEDVTSCLETRGDKLARPDQAAQTLSLFRGWAVASLLPTLVVQGFSVSDSDVDALVQRARVLDYVARSLSKFTTYVGSRTPSTLLLGDVRHGHLKGDATDLRSAFMPYGATSGHYLLSQLVNTFGYASLKHVGVANACDDDDAFALYTLLRKPYTVALGRRASKVAKWANHDVEHPQYRRRFRHAAGEVYARQIFERS
jgi:thymidylate kinase